VADGVLEASIGSSCNLPTTHRTRSEQARGRYTRKTHQRGTRTATHQSHMRRCRERHAKVTAVENAHVRRAHSKRVTGQTVKLRQRTPKSNEGNQHARVNGREDNPARESVPHKDEHFLGGAFRETRDLGEIDVIRQEDAQDATILLAANSWFISMENSAVV
jgi:hypothetical protein